MVAYEKRGYLTENFKAFYLSDTTCKEIVYHYHDFDKIIYFIAGNIEYTIEGKTYLCNEKDFIFVSHGTLHKLKVMSKTPYKRIVLYLKPEFLRESNDAVDLGTCFDEVLKKECNVLHFTDIKTEELYSRLLAYKEEVREKKFGQELLVRTIINEFLIQINRAVLQEEVIYLPNYHENNKISTICKYVNKNLYSDLSIKEISSALYISRYYLMHLFKEETGETLASYIASKRLAFGRSLIYKGVPITEACYGCGYKEYSTFLRAYRKKYGEAPKELRK
jgi:AraC-like DNA-binding protein